jgi:hypothetical protein
MPGNNPNQNQSLNGNKSKEPVQGFPGMKQKLVPEDYTHTERSTQEVIDARIANSRTSDQEDDPSHSYEEQIQSPKDARTGKHLAKNKIYDKKRKR